MADDDFVPDAAPAPAAGAQDDFVPDDEFVADAQPKSWWQTPVGTGDMPVLGSVAKAVAPYVPAAISDIPKEVGHAYHETAQSASNLNPWSEDNLKARDAYYKELAEAPDLVSKGVAAGKNALGNLGTTAKGVLDAGLLFGTAGLAPAVQGAWRSLVGHGLESASHAVGEVIAPENAKKVDRAQAYEEAKAGADKALMALRPSGRMTVTKGPTGKEIGWEAPPPPPKPEAPKTGYFGEVLSEGQATGDRALIAREKAAEKGQLGSRAEQQAVAFREEQEGIQVPTAKELTAQEVAPGSPTGIKADEAAQTIANSLTQRADRRTQLEAAATQQLEQVGTAYHNRLSPTNTALAETPAEAANIASGAITRAEERANQAVDAAYAKFRGMKGEFHPASWNNAAKEIRNRVASPENPTQMTLINPQTTPQSQSMLDAVEHIFGGIAQRRNELGQVQPRTPVTPELVENARKRLNEYYGNALNAARQSGQWEDARSARKIIDEFDKTVERKLQTSFVGGDPADVLSSLKAARKSYSDWYKDYVSLGPGDKVGPKIQQVLGKYEGQALTPEQVEPLLYSKSSVPFVERLKKLQGADSPEFGALKQGYNKLITEAPPGKSPYTPGQVADRIEAATRGSGRSLTEAYLSPQEIAALQQRGRQLKQFHELTTQKPDRVDALFSKIVGDGQNAPASIKHVTDKLFRDALNNATDSPEIVKRIYSQLGGRDSPAGNALRSGMLRTAVEDGMVERDFMHQKTRDNLMKLVNSEVGREVYTPAQREVIRKLADFHEKLVIPPGTKVNWSGIGGAEKPMFDRVVSWLAGLAGAAVAHAVSPFGGIAGEALNVGAGVATAKVVNALENRRHGKVIEKQMPILGEQAQKYFKALTAHGKADTPMSRAGVATAAASLNTTAQKLLQSLPTAVREGISLTSPVPAQEQEKKRADGGGVSAQGPFISDEDLSVADAQKDTRPWYQGVLGIGGPRMQTLPEKLVRQAPDVASGIGKIVSGDQPTWDRLTGSNDVQREQTWPEQMVRGAGSLLSGQTQMIDPLTGHISDEAIQQGMDVAGLGGTGGFGRVASPARVAMSETSKPGAAVAAAEHGAQPFYSAVERTVQNAPQAKMTPEQWGNWLKNQPGVKAGELAHLGVDDWLKGQQGSVTKEQFLDHINQNKLELKEVEKGNADLQSVIDDLIKEKHEDFFKDEGRRPNQQERAEIAKEVEEYVRDDPGEYGNTRYDEHQLPGGENYREMLLTLPEWKGPKSALSKVEQQELLDLLNKDDRAQARGASISPEEEARLTSLQQRQGPPRERVEPYRTPHWDEPNVLAHTRYNTRDIGGKKALFLEELQSDLHQQGRKSGYQDAAYEEGLKRWGEFQQERKELFSKLDQEAGRQGIKNHDEFSEWAVSDKNPYKAELDKNNAEYQPLMKKYSEYGGSDRSKLVPDFPFKKTWPELTLKRMIRHAAENGHDAIAWTPGEVQAARYDLSKQIDHIDYRRKGNNYELGVVDKNGHGVDLPKKEFTAEELSNVIGKEVAEKIVNGEGKPGGGRMTLSGLDLKVGGEGMLKFYDDMLPAIANKIGKPYGAKVEQRKISEPGAESPREYYIQNTSPTGNGTFDIRFRNALGDERWVRSFETKAEAEKVLARIKEKEEAVRPGQHAVHYMELTPSLKEQALTKGFPLFSDTSKPGVAVSAVGKSSKGFRNYGLSSEEESMLSSWKNAGDSVPEHAYEDLQRSAAFGKALQKLPAYEGLVYRGTDIPESVLTQLRPGKSVTLDTHAPATTDRKWAIGSAGVSEAPNAVPTLLQVRQASGREIPKEYYPPGIDDGREIVLPKETKYDVVRVEPAKAGQSYHKVVLQESPNSKRPTVRLMPFKAELFSDTGTSGIAAGSQKQDVPRPVENQPGKNAEDEPKARAAGGRVEARNINHNPTEAQKEAGNYAKDTVHLHGLEIAIENAKGSKRRGVGEDGKPWEATLPAHYGYFRRGPEGKDGDKIDVYLGPHLKSQQVFAIDQVDHKSKVFDEHKIGLGFGSMAQFIAIYKRAFSDGKGKDRIGRVHTLTLPLLKAWLAGGNHKKPLG